MLRRNDSQHPDRKVSADTLVLPQPLLNTRAKSVGQVMNRARTVNIAIDEEENEYLNDSDHMGIDAEQIQVNVMGKSQIAENVLIMPHDGGKDDINLSSDSALS